MLSDSVRVLVMSASCRMRQLSLVITTRPNRAKVPWRSHRPNRQYAACTSPCAPTAAWRHELYKEMTSWRTVATDGLINPDRSPAPRARDPTSPPCGHSEDA